VASATSPNTPATAGDANPIRSFSPSGSFFPMGLTNSGPIVAFNSRDADHMGDIWLADLQKGTMTRTYQAAAAHEVFWLRIDGGRLVWLEYRHAADDGSGSVAEWWIRTRSLLGGTISDVAHDTVARDRPFPFIVRALGDRLAEALKEPDGTIQIDVRSAATGRVTVSVPVAETLYDVALAGSDAVLWSAGTNVPELQTIKDLHLYRWSSPRGTVKVADGAFAVRADGQWAAWITDMQASTGATGHPVAPSLSLAGSPFSDGRLVPGSNAAAVKAINGFDTVDGWVAWSADVATGANTGTRLMMIGPGWTTARTLSDRAGTPWVSLGGGWVAWYHEGDGGPDPDSVFGLDLATAAQSSP
jgi:hypothetical protein